MPARTSSYRAARIAAGYKTQLDAAKALGVQPANLCRWERGGVSPKDDALRRMVEVYGLTAGQILGLEPLPVNEEAV
jgi:transcriptional regulator with XRE-family HTH domain